MAAAARTQGGAAGRAEAGAPQGGDWQELASESPGGGGGGGGSRTTTSSSLGGTPAAADSDGDEEPPRIYHHCRRLRRARDRLLKRPACLACLVATVAVAGAFFAGEAWWLRTRRWPGLRERDVLAAPQIEQQRMRPLGCYPLLDGDAGAGPAAGEEGAGGGRAETELYVEACMTKPAAAAGASEASATGGARCRSGLPFYSFSVAGEQTVSWRMCAEFCLLKGLDVSGVVDAVECRCGASAENRDVWQDGGARRPDLAWQPPEAALRPGDPACRIVAARYAGPLPIPRQAVELNDRDLAYVEGVIRGRRIQQLTDSGQPLERSRAKVALPAPASSPAAAPAVGDGIEEDDLLQAWSEDDTGIAAMDVRRTRPTLRPCYPHQCAAGLPWPLRTTYATGIPYAFAEQVTESTKEAFRGAVMAYHAATCITFNEVSPSFDKEYKILVKTDEDGCFTSPVGYPMLYRQDTEINLGWCTGDRQIGNMIHELGHAVGMAHEHMRPDRDDYVRIDYTGMSPVMAAQYAKDDTAYTGSAQRGPAVYDYQSLMHYPATKEMRTLPLTKGGTRGVHDAETGQRRGFSVEDVKQLRDMYQCDHRFEELCVDMDRELGEAMTLGGRPATCAQVSKYCTYPKFEKEISYFCPRSCRRCSKVQTPGSVSSNIQGCRDSNRFCERYKAYCPGGLVSGQEQWMAENCRRTCNIPRYCAQKKAEENWRPEEPDISSEAMPNIFCMDSAHTGLVNALGQAESCAGVRQRCQDPAVGAQVRAACPASCGLCRKELTGVTEAEEATMSRLKLELAFVLGGGGYDLAAWEQEAQLQDALSPVLRSLYREDVDLAVSHEGACGSPCHEGLVTISARCCNALVPGCTVECEELRGTFLRRDAKQITTEMAGRGFAGVAVKTATVAVSVDHVFHVMFTAEWLVEIMTCVGVAAGICLTFSITMARCVRKGRGLGRGRGALALGAAAGDLSGGLLASAFPASAAGDSPCSSTSRSSCSSPLSEDGAAPPGPAERARRR